MKSVKICMGIEILMVFLNGDEENRDVGTMVGNPLQIGQRLNKGKGGIDGTLPIPQAGDMGRFQLLLQNVDHLLQRLYPMSQRQISAAVS